MLVRSESRTASVFAQDGAGATKDFWFMIGIIKTLVFEVHKLIFSLMQVWAKITLINPDAVTSPLGTAALSRSEMVKFQFTVEVEGMESKGSERA